MKNILAFFVLLLIMSCKEANKTINNLDETKNIEKAQNRVNILDHPLIFEDLEIKIESFTSEEKKKDTFLIDIVVSSQHYEKFSMGHFFFIHAFEYNSASDTAFINLDTKDGLIEDDKLVFKSQVVSKTYDFKELRFGLVKRLTKERYFVRTLTDVSIKD
jgi:hypothetical protein